ncbi:hypothetical protein SAMN05444724_0682 [Salinivibrio sp. ES.052]|nr:hypothetical protein SAMN05444724_0682 [Salinivibrio sp. ES.052]
MQWLTKWFRSDVDSVHIPASQLRRKPDTGMIKRVIQRHFLHPYTGAA